MILNDKVVAITGASDGIGKEIALKLARESAKLCLIARNEERLKEVKNRCLELGSPKSEYYICDLTQQENLISTKEKIISEFGTVDILINNAGIWQKTGQLEEVTLEDIDKVISTNLTGVIMLTNLLIPLLKTRDESAIINITSQSGIEAKLGQSVYCASKWGVAGFTKTLRMDLKGTNLRVAGVYQGGTKTSLFEKAGDPKDTETFNKFTNPEDLADVVLFMLSRPPKIWLHDVRIEY